ncbi:uncharacterized protein LOC122723279, partial [Manihot esculenta]|uniref:uncharacterized protein LOC122723279 n=2 Tax=Manihot esculenta TaxID=3983 RepID=UPI001CC5A284
RPHLKCLASERRFHLSSIHFQRRFHHPPSSLRSLSEKSHARISPRDSRACASSLLSTGLIHRRRQPLLSVVLIPQPSVLSESLCRASSHSQLNLSKLYKLFESHLHSTEVLLRYSSALVQGATNVFWIDIQTNTRHFQSLFRYLLEEVALEPKRLNKIPLQAQQDLFLLLSRSLLFYNLDDKLEIFLKHFPVFPNAFLVGGPVDFFVIELADRLQKLKVEPVLLHYLSQNKILQVKYQFKFEKYGGVGLLET